MTQTRNETSSPAVRKRSRTPWLLALLIVALCALAAPALILFRFATSPAPLAAPGTTVDIPNGMGLRAIARILYARQVVSSEPLFILLARVNRSEGQLRAGEYDFEEGVTPLAVLKTLETGRMKQYRVTLQEGWTVQEMSETIGKLGIVDADQLIRLTRDPAFARSLNVPFSTLEGYCFPDTYALNRGMTAESILKLLVLHFREVYAAERDAAPERAKLKLDQHEIVTLASIVEKETGLAEERPLIAAVFHNRLRRGIPLQSDPTVIYGLEDFDGNLTRAHLKSPTPYNTYTRNGLPPGPIANPGRASLRAVMNPPSVDYLFFVSRNDGSHQFSRTLAEHNRAVAHFQRGRGRAPRKSQGRP